MAITQIRAGQMKNGTITDTQINASANIASSKLFDGGNWIKRDGSIAMTGNLDMGNQKIVNLGTATLATDALNKGAVDTAFENLNSLFDSKGSVRCATTGNITLSGTQTIDGVSAIASDRVLVKNQTAPAENGIYIVSAGSWTRSTDFDLWAEIPGGMVAVEEGTTLADTVWLCTSNAGGTLGTTAINFQNIASGSGLSTSNFVFGEVPSGTINGSNTTFTLANSPTAGTVQIQLNGIMQLVGAGNDYTITGSTITFLSAPLTGDVVLVSYMK